MDKVFDIKANFATIRPTIDFYNFGNNTKKVSFIKSFADRISSSGISKTQKIITDLKNEIQYIKTEKVSIALAKRIIIEIKQVLELINFFLKWINKFDVDDPIAQQLIENTYTIRDLVNDIVNILKSYIEVDYAKKEIKKGEILTHKEVFDGI